MTDKKNIYDLNLDNLEFVVDKKKLLKHLICAICKKYYKDPLKLSCGYFKKSHSLSKMLKN